MVKENSSKKQSRKLGMVSKLFLCGAFLGGSLFGCAANSSGADKDSTIKERVFFSKKTGIETKIPPRRGKDSLMPQCLDMRVGIKENDQHKENLNVFPSASGKSNPAEYTSQQTAVKMDKCKTRGNIGDKFIKEYQEIRITKNEVDYSSFKLKNKAFRIMFPFLLLCFGAGGYFLVSRREKIKKYAQFLASLPELSKPGIKEDQVYDFLKGYSKNTPTVILKLAVSKFMSVLPDANMLSQLEVMVLANIAKNEFRVNNDLEFCSSIANIIEKYDRSVLGYEDLLSTVRRVAKKNIKLFPASGEIKESLLRLNRSSEKLSIYSHKKKYDRLLRKAEEFRKNAEDSEAQMVLEEAVLMNPGRSEAYFRVSEVYNFNDRFVDAIAVLDDLIVAEPCKPVLSTAYLKRADLFLSQGNYNAALQDLERVDNGDYRKYRTRDLCIIESDRTKSGKEKLAVLAKEFFHCYVKPGLFYWKNSRKNFFFFK